MLLAAFRTRVALPWNASSFDLGRSPARLDQAPSLGVRELEYISDATSGEIDTIDALGEFFREPHAHRSSSEQTICLWRAARYLVLVHVTCTVVHSGRGTSGRGLLLFVSE